MNTQGRRFFADTSQSICILSKSSLPWPVFETFVELFNSANSTTEKIEDAWCVKEMSCAKKDLGTWKKGLG